jgi:hypothetical protein
VMNDIMRVTFRFREVTPAVVPDLKISIHLENNPETSLSAHHPVIGSLGLIERIDFIHGADLLQLTELECFL